MRPILLLLPLLLAACQKPQEANVPAPDPGEAEARHSGFGLTSFDCGTARSYGEVTACGDARIAAKDSELAALYAQLQRQGLLTDEVKAAQRAWLKQRDDCTSEACVAKSYDDRLQALQAHAATPDPEVATELDGVFAVSGVEYGESWTQLLFDEVALSMENEKTLRVKDRSDPRIDRAAGSVAALNVETATPAGKRLIEACAGGCNVDALVEQPERGMWVIKTLRKATPHEHPAGLDVAKDDARRKPLLDALLAHMERDFGQPLKLQDSLLRERDGHAFAVVRPLDRAGQPLDLSKTRYADASDEGMLDGDLAYAYLHREGGGWKVRGYAYAPTDAAWADWPDGFSAPPALFRLGN